jgi:hypothetical protein
VLNSAVAAALKNPVSIESHNTSAFADAAAELRVLLGEPAAEDAAGSLGGPRSPTPLPPPAAFAEVQGAVEGAEIEELGARAAAEAEREAGAAAEAERGAGAAAELDVLRRLHEHRNMNQSLAPKLPCECAIRCCIMFP